jgi:hypothetical protein
MVMEVGNLQSIADLMGICNRILSLCTSIKVFVFVAYNRNATFFHICCWQLCILLHRYAPELQRIIRPVSRCMKPRKSAPPYLRVALATWTAVRYLIQVAEFECRLTVFSSISYIGFFRIYSWLSSVHFRESILKEGTTPLGIL